jgi:hypothetical protein
MFYHSVTSSYIQPNTAFTLGDIQYPANWLTLATPEDISLAGLTEVTTVGERADDRYFWVSQTLDNGVYTITNTPKDSATLSLLDSSMAQAEIKQIEEQSLLPRVLRIFLLSTLDPTSFEYAKVKEVDDKITNLRTRIISPAA